jgi:heat shock protein HslJ
MKRLKIVLFALCTLAALALSACAGGRSSSPEGEWRLVSYGDAANPTPAVLGVDTTITFASNGQVMGNVGCNSFSGDYRVSGSQITFDPIISTLMACEDPIGTQEAEVFHVFTDTVSFQLSGDTMTITTPDGSSVVVLERK